MTGKSRYKFRKAKISDCPNLEELIVESSESINGRYYDEHIIKAAIGNIWIVDEQLILDGTYWLVENEDNDIVGCGGWSRRNLLFGNSKTMKATLGSDELNPDIDPARIRAFFVHPNYTRQGIGKELMDICENEAMRSGFSSLELVATLSGEKLYVSCGFNEKKRIQIDLGNGVFGEAIEMFKVLEKSPNLKKD